VTRRRTGPAITSAGNRVPRSVVSLLSLGTARHEVEPVMLPLNRRTSAREASINGENASKAAKAPPAERERTLSCFPGVPRPWIPN